MHLLHLATLHENILNHSSRKCHDTVTMAAHRLLIIKTRSIHIDASVASLLHCIENILNHSPRKCHDTVTMAALSFTKSTAIIVIISSRKG